MKINKYHDTELEDISKIIYSIKPWDEYVEQTLNDHSAKKAIVKIFNILQSEKQLSYQEAVENIEKWADTYKGVSHMGLGDDGEIGYYKCLDDLRHQLSILKGEKK